MEHVITPEPDMRARVQGAQRSRLRHFLLMLACCALTALSLGSARGAAIGSARLDQLPQVWTDDRGEVVRLSQFTGQRVILTMAFAGCHQQCPAAIAELKFIQKALDARNEQVQIVVFGLDPENENAATWHEYRKSHRLQRENWHFLTGSPDDTERLAHQLGFDFWRLDEHVVHDTRALIFDPKGLLASELGNDPSIWHNSL